MQPVAQPPRKLPLSVRDAVEEKLADLEQLDIIKQDVGFSFSGYS